ncbi:MAG: restriction endonuclease subunit S, partial [Candidatus Marinimicrobia bacterium]|nr:restriction endonuclease subunit S [Candidatus Neomarinimicrobiota bacterium]
MMEEWKKTEIGLMPIDWEVNRIDNFFSIQQGKQVSKKNRIGDNQKPFLRTKNIFWGRLDLDELDQMNFTKSEEEKYELKKGDLLVCEGGSVGRTAIWDGAISGCYYQNHLHRVRRLTKNTIPEFVSYWFYYAFEFGKVYFGRANETTLSNLSKSRLSELHIPHPELNEQRKIAYVLSTIQKAIEQQDKLIKTTTELKKALMQKLFTEGLYGEKQKQTEIGPVPESWEQIKIGELGRCITGTTPRTKIEEYWNNPDYDFIAPADIGTTKYIYKSEKQISEAGLGVSRVLPKNSVMCVCIGSSIGKVGLTYQEKSSTNQQINSIICSDSYYPVYVYYLLLQLSEYWRSHATFGPVPILNKGQFEQIKIYVTKDKAEQKEIASSLELLDTKIEFHEKKKQTLTDLLKTLLHELMTGQRRVHEIEFENGLEL